MSEALSSISTSDTEFQLIPPAQQLLGRVLPGGWEVIEKVPRPRNATGGHFSEGYVVQGEGGRKGFLKALDYSSALRSPDPARMLQALTAAYNFERDLLNRCRARRLDRVVTAFAEGSISVDSANPLGPVQYLIFDLAKGDIRQHINTLSLREERFSLATSLRVLHHVATGLMQLHRQGIAHQDLKPSNVLIFERDSKVADLGRAACQSLESPHDDYAVAGDHSYAPPELLYRYIPGDWNVRRLGCDAYLLGSLAVFLFAGVGMTSMLMLGMDERHRWNNWGGTFKEVLPFVQNAFARALQQIEASIPHQRDALIAIVEQLCEPDPEKRGHPRTRHFTGNPFSLERYVTNFDLLARRTELDLLAEMSR